MQHKLRFLLIAVAVAVLASGTVAQVAGDFGSAGTGVWSASASWVIFVSASDWSDATPAGSAPTGADNVYVRATHTITIDANAECNNLTIYGTLNTKTTSSPVSYAITGDVTVGSATITNVSSTAGFVFGDAIANATNLASATSIVAFDATTITLNKNAILDGTTVALTVYNNNGIDFTVNGNISIESTGRLLPVANSNGISSPNGGLMHSLTLKGNIVNSNTTNGFDARVGTAGSTGATFHLILSGTSTCTLNVPFVSTGNGEFNRITINKTGGAKVILASDIICAAGSGTAPENTNTSIVFTSGIVETGSFKLGIVNPGIYTAPALERVRGYSSSSYVNGNFARGMSTTVGIEREFPVGDANGYRPVKVRSTTVGTANGHYAQVKCIAGDANTGSSNLLGGIDKVSAVRYYQVTYGINMGTTGGAATMNFDLFNLNYGTDDYVAAGNTDLRVAYSGAGDARVNWTGIAQTTTHNTTDGSTLTQITPDALGTAVTLTAASTNTMHVALARATGTTTNPLPVELTSFSASMVNATSALLQWHTATEINNFGFEVERRGEGSSEWTKIGSVAGSGTSNTPKDYSYQDVNLIPGVNVYRLKQIDLDGAFKYSASTQVDVGVSKGFELLSNYPNPFNPATTIRFSVPENGYATLKVFNMLGQEVATLFSGMAQAGHYIPVTFNAGNLSSGIYFSRLDYNGRSLVQRMLLTK